MGLFVTMIMNANRDAVVRSSPLRIIDAYLSLVTTALAVIRRAKRLNNWRRMKTRGF